MLELFQTEWCPASRRVRQRLTELGLDYLNRQVPVEREERTVLARRRPAPTRSRRCCSRTARRSSARRRHSRLPRRAIRESAARPRRIEPRRPRRAAATWRRNADARHWLHAERDDAAPIRRRCRARPRRAEGGGVRRLCEIDVQATLREKLGVEGEPYLILGACNPRSPTRRWRQSPNSACCCPATSSSTSAEGETQIAAIDPERMLSIVDNDQLAPVAAEVKRAPGRRRRARLQRLSPGAPTGGASSAPAPGLRAPGRRAGRAAGARGPRPSCRRRGSRPGSRRVVARGLRGRCGGRCGRR